MTQSGEARVDDGDRSVARPAWWLLAVLAFVNVGLLLLASVGWAGVGATAVVLAAEICVAIFLLS